MSGPLTPGPATPGPVRPPDPVRLGIVGCGDVAFRTYLPGLASLGGDAEVVAVADRRRDNAERAAAGSRARVYEDADQLVADPDVEAVINLTPPAFHGDVIRAALEAGRHVYTEKPLAGTVEQAQELAALAAARDRLLLCAPGVMATNRFRWLRQVIDSGRIGRPTLATGQITGMGPAAWHDYTGDVAVFYAAGGGPLLDTGIYLLHAITGLMGPVRRVQALGGVAIPERRILARSQTGSTVEVVANDHMLVQLELAGGGLAQITSSFAVARSAAPTLELHCTGGSVAVDDFYDANGRGSTELYLFDETTLGLGGRLPDAGPPRRSRVRNLIVAGAAHFVACVRGEETPILTAEHAVHVLDIMVHAQEAALSGASVSLDTSFEPDPNGARPEGEDAR